MLKIVTNQESRGVAMLYLEGQVVGPWVDELGRVCESLLSAGSRLHLDLSNVSFVSLEGVELLSALRDRQACRLHCSAFVEEQLKAYRR
jgi:hypothetical protein